jgi:hypothetical protein
VLRRVLGAARGEELVHFGAIAVHNLDRTTRRAELGCTAGTPIDNAAKLRIR